MQRCQALSHRFVQPGTNWMTDSVLQTEDASTQVQSIDECRIVSGVQEHQGTGAQSQGETGRRHRGAVVDALIR